MLKQERKHWDIVFSTMTRLETEFVALIAQQFRASGYEAACITYDQSARTPLRASGVPCFSIHEMMDCTAYRDLDAEQVSVFLESFGIRNIRNLFIHEILGYGRTDEGRLFRKTIHFLQVLDAFFRENDVGCILQELGGFAGYNAVYYAARRHGVPHIFWEPSSFPKRVFFTLDGFYADVPHAILDADAPEDSRLAIRKFVDDYLLRPTYIVPAKDRHSFRDMTLSRLFNAFNAKRLSSKIYKKYVSGEREEFDEIGHYVRTNVLKLIRRQMFSRFYSEVNDVTFEKYIYYPLHVPHDVQLSVRSKLFYFQEGFVEYLCRILPYGYTLLVKEHPAAIGAHSYNIWKRLLKKHSNLKLIHPKNNSFDLIKGAALVITVNSKVGFEAIIQQKRVIVVGDVFYKGKGLTFDVENLEVLEKVVFQALDADPPTKEQVLDFLAKVHAWSFPCDLFDTSRENCVAGFNAIHLFLQRNKLIRDHSR